MNSLPWFRFFPADWIKGTRELDPLEKAIWIDLLAYMWESRTRGKIVSTWAGIARMTGVQWLECESVIMGMKDKGLFDVTLGNGSVTLISARMQREENTRESAKLRKRRFDERFSNANVTRQTHMSEVRVIKDKDVKTKKTRFEKPTAQLVSSYAESIGFKLDGQQFCDFYESKGWLIGRSPMKSWQAAVRTWKNAENVANPQKPLDPALKTKMDAKIKELEELGKRDFERKSKIANITTQNGHVDLVKQELKQLTDPKWAEIQERSKIA